MSVSWEIQLTDMTVLVKSSKQIVLRAEKFAMSYTMYKTPLFHLKELKELRILANTNDSLQNSHYHKCCLWDNSATYTMLASSPGFPASLSLHIQLLHCCTMMRKLGSLEMKSHYTIIHSNTTKLSLHCICFSIQSTSLVEDHTFTRWCHLVLVVDISSFMYQ